MKKVYIILTYSGTILSKIIRLRTGQKYSHSSIALDEDLEKMYSFGRLHPSNPFFAGFVEEGVNKGTFKRFKNTVAEVYSIEVTDEQYEKITNTIEDVKNNRKKYKYNINGLIFAIINKRYNHEYCFYCAEFVKYILENAGIDVSDFSYVVKPMDFRRLSGKSLMYTGYLRKYTTEGLIQ